MIDLGELEIDSRGRIWRVAFRAGLRGGGTRQYKCQRHRAEYSQKHGYLLVATMFGGKRTAASAHRVVWTHFNGPIPPGLTINHKNGVKTDNRPANLELATMSEQRRHALDVLQVNRNRPKGSKNPKTKLTEADVLEIRRLRSEGMLNREIASRYGMKPKAISAIVTRRNWKHI